ncbi:metalloprotease PmbA [Thiomonas sp.]|uniref:metalloprotease PmbA n=1 Tax=Thiomonas sp. TaxID=2047785 RepID=UPI00262C73C2|nr:metalloprotease PmbA [Thiomonas sp.]
MGHFAYSPSDFQELAALALREAREAGASDAAVEVSEGQGLSVNVRLGRVEQVEHNTDKGLDVTVYAGQRRGHASTSDFSAQAIRSTVRAAFDIARYTAEDDCAGLPEPELLAGRTREPRLYHPWDPSVEQAVELARRAEDAAFATDRRIRNSEGASVSAQHMHFLLANSRGFSNGYASSRHSLSCVPIAGRGNDMQRDYWWSSHRDATRLADPEALGRYAAERSLSRLRARKIPTGQYPVLFEAPLAAGLIGSLVHAASGGTLYRKASFLVDQLGKQVLAPHLDLMEDPGVPDGMGSAPFDDEGVRTSKRRVVRAGVLEGYFLSTYSGRKLGMPTTGNAGGSHNLSLSSRLTRPGDDLAQMLRKLDRGLFVIELIGHGINYVTGDYSRGAMGFWVEGGEIRHPVHEITVAGNLRDMLRGIRAVGADVHVSGSRRTGSILLESMTVAGS